MELFLQSIEKEDQANRTRSPTMSKQQLPPVRESRLHMHPPAEMVTPIGNPAAKTLQWK